MQFCKAQVRAVKAKTGTDAERFYDIFRSEAVLTYRPGPVFILYTAVAETRFPAASVAYERICGWR